MITQEEARYYSDKATLENPSIKKNLNRLKNKKEIYPSKLDPTDLAMLNVKGENYTRWAEEQNQKVKVDEYSFEPFNLKQICDYKEDNNGQIMEGISLGDKILSYGDSNSFKTLTSIYRGLCVASKRKYLNTFRIKKQCPVLFLSAEDNPVRNMKKIKPILRGLKIRKKEKIPFYTIIRKDCHQLTDSEYFDYVCEIIEDYQIKWIIFDTAILFFQEMDDNKARDVNLIYTEFIHKISDKYGCVCEMIAHTDKARNSFLGSTKWKGNSDVVLRVERKDLDFCFSIYNEKNKDVEKDVLDVNIDIKYDKKEKNIVKTSFKLIGTSQPKIFNNHRKRSIKSDRVRKAIIEITKESNEEFLLKDIFESINKKYKNIAKKSTFYSTINKMINNDELIEKEFGYILKDGI